MNKISRYILVLIAVLASAVALPNLYWLAFEKPVATPFILYSSSDNDFFIMNHGNENVRTDTKGNVYTREEFEQKLPLFYARQLVLSGILPDSLNGRELDIHEINHYRSTFRLKPQEIHAPVPGMYPLFESESGRANLEMPLDFFRIGDRMEFVMAAENVIDERKSQMFTTVLNNREFAFPAKLIAGIPTTRKSCDEGYLVVDSKDVVFHVKMIKGKPYVKRCDVPEGVKFKYISCVDQSDKRFYAYMISEENMIYGLTQDDYAFDLLPFKGYDADNHELRIYGNMFHYTVIAKGVGEVKVAALDKELNVVDEYSETWIKREDSKSGKIASVLFPAQVNLSKWNSTFVDFYVDWAKGFWWIVLNLVLVVVQVIVVRRKGLVLKKNVLDLVIVGVCGVFGFIGVNFFQNKFFE